MRLVNCGHAILVSISMNNWAAVYEYTSNCLTKNRTELYTLKADCYITIKKINTGKLLHRMCHKRNLHTGFMEEKS